MMIVTVPIIMKITITRRMMIKIVITKITLLIPYNFYICF